MHETSIGIVFIYFSQHCVFNVNFKAKPLRLCSASSFEWKGKFLVFFQPFYILYEFLFWFCCLNLMVHFFFSPLLLSLCLLTNWVGVHCDQLSARFARCWLMHAACSLPTILSLLDWLDTDLSNNYMTYYIFIVGAVAPPWSLVNFTTSSSCWICK